MAPIGWREWVNIPSETKAVRLSQNFYLFHPEFKPRAYTETKPADLLMFGYPWRTHHERCI